MTFPRKPKTQVGRSPSDPLSLEQLIQCQPKVGLSFFIQYETVLNSVSGSTTVDLRLSR
ncbi:hypothetical protein H6F90_11970 [Trichocoleus sp. FACHB-591]|nr:hypothetical protein [Trichocoleus sp. FACHB-591]